jgi:hypothetical protein
MNYSCPARPWLDHGADLFFLYDTTAHYRNGFLLTEGGVLDQPSKLMEALSIVGDELENCKDEKSSEQSARESHVAHQNTVSTAGAKNV